MTPSAVVSVLIPTRNEAQHISACIAAIAGQDYPLDLIEVVLVDGCSEDGTAAIAKEALARTHFRRVEVARNVGATTPSNLNMGLALLRGDIVCRVDGRSLIPTRYVRRCVEILAARPEVAVVGGAQVAVPPRPDAVGAGIARGLNNRYAMGLSRYRRGAASGPSDTVYLGSFRTHDLRRAGGWDVALETNQDFDLNRRLSRHGQIWFESGLDVQYVPRGSLLALFSQYVRFGRWKVRFWRHTGERPVPRQVLLLAAPPASITVGLPILIRASSRGRLLLFAAGAAGAAAVEVVGADEPRAGPRGHAVAVAAIAATSSGWLIGVLREFLDGRFNFGSPRPGSSGSHSGEAGPVRPSRRGERR